ncbi:Tripeptidyl-peptidase [Lachnellula occidentalis]|uniref:Tripeptidyl-peptidase n=1 Tax=Lachnellula occidentalis TaxID=215460 RepID=A0A8H8UDZ5_9HELO|nr:Tripeptidyl-peptidase [Lachnellula occidentalis]
MVVATTDNHVIHEKRSAAPGVQRLSRMDPNSTVPIRVALAQQNLESAEEYLMSVSDPTSLHYSQYWTAEAVARKFSPSTRTLKQVTSWLDKSGIAANRLRGSRSRGELHFNSTVREAEQLFNTTYYLYETLSDGATYIGCEEYSLPSYVQSHVDFITPTIQLDYQVQRRQLSSIKDSKDMFQSSSPKSQKNPPPFSKRQTGAKDTLPPFPKRQSSSLPSGCDQITTPDCLRALYHIPVDNFSHPDNSLGVVEFGWGAYLPKDLSMFFQQFKPTMIKDQPIFKSIDGGTFQDVVEIFAFNGEPALDLAYTMILTSPLNITNYQVGDLWDLAAPTGMNNFLAALDKTYCSALDPQYDSIYPHVVPAAGGLPAGYNHSDCGTEKPTHVISVSYLNDEITLSPAYERRQCMEYLKLGLQGVTMIFAAGDYGTAGANNTCIDPNTGAPTQPGVSGNFQATFPATCPYVTSVGGTQLPANASTLDTEVAWESILKQDNQNGTSSSISKLLSSGGGFSNVFAAPAYQCNAVESYFQLEKSRLMNISSRFNLDVNGVPPRGFPDVALNANAYSTVVDGKPDIIDGTSASAPTFASIIANINGGRLKRGKKPVGFLNPVLYANPQMLNDVVSGVNYDCVRQPSFHAAVGWDPVTGLGTPDFDRMLEVFLELP